MKRFVVPLGVSIALVISGAAAAAVFSSSGSSTGPAAGAQSRESDEPREADTGHADDAGVHEAAQSDCGKPMVAVNHGGGPPANALANREAHVPDQAPEHGPPLSVPPSGS